MYNEMTSKAPPEPLLAKIYYHFPSEMKVTISKVLNQWPFVQLSLLVATWLLTFFVLDQFMVRGMHLSAEGYSQSSLALAIIQRLGLAGCLVLAGGCLFLWRFGLLFSPWSALQHGTVLRVLIVFLAAVVAWPLTTYGYNYFFDQGYYFDRLLIILLIPLVWYRPVFLLPFLMLAFASLYQFREPILNSGSHLPHKLQVLHVLNLFAGLFLLHAATGSRRSDGFFFMACCLVAAGYWQPAMTKLDIGWVTHGQLFLMPLSAYAHGWLSFLDASSLIKFAGILEWFDWPMRLFVLTIEIGVLVFLLHRWVSIILLACLMLFHVAVFALYGYLFWTWFLLNGALLVILWRDRHQQSIKIYSKGHLFLAAILIYTAPYWCSPPSLGWFDTRLSYTYRYVATGQSGTQYTLPFDYFAPYDDVFTMANFSYLIDQHGLLVASYGITGFRHRAEGLMAINTADEVFALEESIGANRYKPERAEDYYNFIQKFVETRNRGDREPGFIKYVRAPRQFWSYPRGNVYTGQEPLKEVVVKEVTTLFDDRELTEIREIDLRRIKINGITAN